ncbi:SDR family NAD(P)-dependent oxidoreductase [Mycobacterium avium]|jgi:NAD(P)-dependent dehydrogenase (short-subunit alcohol dehydrogenase family)|uniref:SDR family NAD(P)-dependent oxidoreductase n=2 Tax=Mycobacterium avium TaxID=1764 RepID=UPI0004CFB99A|nr:SDR family NAD(P)-dependent oxidoreductase [Mycobacterium avium]AJK75658.1 short-chain dehydrogenase [Mycobacterium avium subsp. paratuberculosis]AJK79833.1 short-chain dehydrogenase [Mycobacterium avium subsp. paratuberculosis]ANH28202.1 short-chain dehydrogenase [Mycobacterium avium subsp. paratuberculosis]ASE15618.1 short-chain dehydrogenase [Mycobacterium avium subsp. paratuberculosis]ASF95643.1 short-chain dehydrogenase [Mycobacterium avium subsp. paratuberculosis]
MSGVRRVAVVTGASRGAGRGISAALADRGWRVYATSRTIGDTPSGVVPVRVDHRDDAAVSDLFDRVRRESGRLDLLVNNAATISDNLVSSKPFWEKPLDLADVLDVGLRSSYVASWYAAPLLVAGGRGLIAFTSSPGSVCYMHGPAYGAQKAGVDKMAADMAVDFRGTGVATVSIWMGILLTEKLRAAFGADPAALAATAEHAETPEFTGYVIDALFDDPGLAELSGQTLIGAELAQRYGITDEGGRRPPSHRDMLGSPRTPSSVVVR